METKTNDMIPDEKLRFRRQWLLEPALRKSPFLEGQYAFSTGHHLQWHSDLQVGIHQGHEETIVILGTLIDLDEQNAVHTVERLLESTEDGLASTAGTYVVIRCDREGIRLYTDPGALMGIYYKNGSASSSPNLLPESAMDQVLANRFKLDERNDWLTGSSCPFAGVKFLLANHSLNLSNSHLERFWPRSVLGAQQNPNAVESCAIALRSFIKIAADQENLLVSLTGGKDSRVNLSLCRDVIDRVEFFTIRSPDVSRCDLKISKRVAELSHMIHHCFIDNSDVNTHVSRAYHEIAGGMSLGARTRILGACVSASRLGNVHLSGALGELGRAYFWPSSKPRVFDPSDILARFANPPASIREGIEEWKSTVPDNLPPSVVYNLFYLEQRGGRWVGIGENASSLFFKPLSAFNSRPFFEAVANVPDAIQYAGRLPDEIIRLLWPKLLDVPFCKGKGFLSGMCPKFVKTTIRKMRK